MKFCRFNTYYTDIIYPNGPVGFITHTPSKNIRRHYSTVLKNKLFSTKSNILQVA